MLIKGIGYFCRISGKPHKTKYSDGEWSFDLSINETTKKELLMAGMKPSFIKNKGDQKGDFLTFRRKSTKADGSEGKPFDVRDHKNEPWDPKVLIGNGSTLNVVVSLNERTGQKGQGYLAPSAIAIQVWDLVPFERGPTFKNRDDGYEPPVKTGTQESW